MTTKQTMSAEGAITATRFPIRLLTIAFVLTAVTIAWFGWVIFDADRDAKIARDQFTRMEELQGVILHFGEVLSGSVRLAVTTGDSKWEDRYRRFEPQLDAAISEMKEFADHSSSALAAAQTDEANIKLVEMENRIFTLVRAGRMQDARAVVFSPEYEKQEQIYAQGSVVFIDQIRRDVDELARQDKRMDFLSLIGALVVLAISFAAWLSVVRGLQRWRTDLEQAVGQRKQAEQALRRANDELELRIGQRTAELGKTNEALQTENTERKRAEEELQRETTLLSNIINASTDFIFVKDRNLRSILCNKAYAEALGKHPEELYGKTDTENGWPPEQVHGDPSNGTRGFEADDRDALTGKTIHNLSDPAMAGQEVRFFDTVKIPLRDAFGTTFGVLGVARDITERRQVDAALRSSEELFRIAAETANDVIYEWDLKQSVQWQGKIDDLLGYEPGEFPRTLDGWAASVHPEDLERTMAAIQAQLEGRAPYAIEYRVRRKDGVYRWWSARGAAARTPDGKPTRLIGSVTDFTERKQAEEALRASEAEFRALTEAMPQMVWITRPDGWNTYFSQQWMDYTGLNLEQSLGHGWNKPFHPEDQQRAWDAWQHAVATTGAYSVECRLRRADGIYRWWLIRGVPQRDTSGDVLKWFGTCTDIHDLKSAELEISRANEALSESKHFAESIAENSTSTIYVFDLETRRTVYSNHNAGESLGYSPTQIIELGENLLPTIMHPEDLPRIVQQLARFPGVPDGRVLDIEYRVKHASGDWHWMWARESVFNRRPNGAPRQILGTAQDITDRKRAQAELEQAHQELVKASRQAGMAEVATGILHNVGNVLNSVNISTGLIVESVKKSRVSSLARVVALLREHAQDLGTFITNDANGKHVPAHLAQLSEHLTADQAAIAGELDSLGRNIEHIKEIVAMQQNYAMVSGVKEMINVVNLVEDSLRLNEGALSRHSVEVVREFAAVPPLNVEKHKILQILVNLVRNAKYACDESERADKRLTMRVANGAGRVRISVMDNGVGISPENLTRIFSHGFTTRKGGHGFGLHSGALAAKELGGALIAHSDGPGRGAVFTLELPLPDAGELI